MSAHEPVSEHDPLAVLYRQLEKLRGAGARGAEVGYEIQAIEQSIGDMIRHRRTGQEHQNEGGRHR